MNVVSPYATTVDALAVAGGPFVVAAGDPLTFTGGPNKPATQYQWDLGDGVTATGMVVEHTYADHGTYVAKLTTIVNEPGGVTTQEFALVLVSSVKPVVDAGPNSTCNEGQIIEYSATFTDREWPEKHTAWFDFGDDTLPVEAPVVETNTAPLAQGSTSIQHAYCENGIYTVTVQVRKTDGATGTATRQVTVLNLPPMVHAEDIFAYPCTPVRLIGCFTDPGWCETHTASWDFGDCTPPQPAVVREEHKPPVGTGTAAATHVYHHCGSYHSVCTVTDDNGASGKAAIVVRAIDVVNREFEHGFRNRIGGTVANGWEPYVATAPAGMTRAEIAAPGSGTLFAGEEFIVHSGRRSQRIAGAGTFSAGIYQSVGANVGWDYQVTVWYSLDERDGGKCRLGVDPEGGLNPTAATIEWDEGTADKEWTQLVVLVTAKKRAITIFLEADGGTSGIAAYFDDVLLVPYPCPLIECKPRTAEEELCVDWKRRESEQLGQRYSDRGFLFQSLTTQPLSLVTWGIPSGQAKIQIPVRGMDVRLPFDADRVSAKIVRYTSAPLEIAAFDSGGTQIGNANTSGETNSIENLELSASGISSLRFTGDGKQALLVELCAYRASEMTKHNPSAGK